ncbi:MAG: hypothetical protein ACRDWI_11440 [Jiangellaceae bacterium]
MSRTPHVPDVLTRARFLARTAAARGLLTANQLESRVWVRMLRGVYRHRDLMADDVVRAGALRLVLSPGAVVAGRTAAWLLGAWRPLPGVPVPLEYARPLSAAGRGFSGTRYRRLALGPPVDDTGWGDITEVHSIPSTSPLRTCFDLMRERALVEAVVVADAFAWAGLLELPWLDAYVCDHRGWPDVVVARRAVELASHHARSGGETRLRMVVVLGGLPEPLINVPVWAGSPSQLVGHPDVLVVHVPNIVGLEYDGAYHDDPGQHAADNKRENSFTVMTGIPLLRYGAADVLRGRQQILHQVTQLSGWPAPYELDDTDFRRPGAALRW